MKSPEHVEFQDENLDYSSFKSPLLDVITVYVLDINKSRKKRNLQAFNQVELDEFAEILKNTKNSANFRDDIRNQTVSKFEYEFDIYLVFDNNDLKEKLRGYNARRLLDECLV